MIGHESFQVVHLESLGLLGRVPAARIPMAAWSQVGIKKLIFAQTQEASIWKGQSASIWVYLNFDAQAKSSSSSEVVKIMSLPATSLQVTAHGFRTSTRFWRFYLPGFMAPAARPDESKSVQVTKLSNQCGTEMLFWKIFHIVLKDFI